MQPETIGTFADKGIAICVGIYMTLLAFRVVGKQPGADLKYDEWHARFGGMLKVMGPFLVAITLLLWVGEAMQPSPPAPSVTTTAPASPTAPTVWMRFNTSDDACSAEFPGSPKRDIKTALGVESHRVTLAIEKPEIYFMLTFSDIPASAPEASDEERLDSLRETMSAYGEQTGAKYTFVRQSPVRVDGVTGRELEFLAGADFIFRAKVFIVGKRIYRAIVVTAKSPEAFEATRQFMDSFRFETGK